MDIPSQFRDKKPTARHILRYSWVLMVTTEHGCQIQKVLGFHVMMNEPFFFSEGNQALPNAKLQALLEKPTQSDEAQSDQYLSTFMSRSTKGQKGLLPLTSEGKKSLNDQRFSPQQKP